MKEHKHGCILVIGFALLVLGSHLLSVYAAQKVKVAILPVKIHAADKMEYLERGLMAMLESHLGGNENVEILDMTLVAKVYKNFTKDLNENTAKSLAHDLGADYLVSGTVTFFGTGGSIDFEVFAADPSSPAATKYKVVKDMNNLLPEFGQVVDDINAGVFAADSRLAMTAPGPPPPQVRAPETIPPAAPKTAVPERRVQPPAVAATPMEPASPRPKSASIRQELVKQPPIIPKARGPAVPQVPAMPPETPWKSQELDQELVAMDLGDLFGDGSKELVAISPEKVFVYRYSGEGLDKLAEYRGPKDHRLLWVSAADINQNGRDEIFVTDQVDLGGTRVKISSFVLEWDGKQLSLALRELNHFLRAVRLPGEPARLLGQKSNPDGSFAPEVYEYGWTNEGYAPVQALSLPESAHIYNARRGDIIGHGDSETIMITPKGYLSLLDRNGHQLWISHDSFGSSENYVELPVNPKDIPQPVDDIENEGYRYAPTQIEDPYIKKLSLPAPILLTDLNRDGKLEIIVIHNLPGLAQLGGGDRYTKGEVLSLSWGGNGMLENWKTGRIEGVLNSVQIGDLTGDGIEEVLVSAVRTGGITSLWRSRKTVILSYALRPE
jgi:hypothetical protein